MPPGGSRKFPLVLVIKVMEELWKVKAGVWPMFHAGFSLLLLSSLRKTAKA
jgi:hypothetical protein